MLNMLSKRICGFNSYFSDIFMAIFDKSYKFVKCCFV